MGGSTKGLRPNLRARSLQRVAGVSLSPVACLRLATFWRKNDISGPPGLYRIDQGLARVCVGAAPGFFSVSRGKFCFPRVSYGLIHSSGLPKLVPY